MNEGDKALLRACAAADARSVSCPLGDWTLEVPPVGAPQALAEVFGLSGQTLGMVFADRAADDALRDLRAHLETHAVDVWVEALLPGKTCSLCGRKRAPIDKDYDPMDVVAGRPLGWYSGEDGEVCPQDMERTVRA